MIPWQVALVSWFAIGAFLMAGRDNARGLALSLLLAAMFLPANVQINIPYIPRVGKFEIAVIAALIGTILFHSDKLTRFRFRWFDGLIALMLAFTLMTSVTNGFGVYDGLSNIMSDIFSPLLVYFLVRVHLCTMQGLRMFLIVLVWLSVLYTPLAVWEFRMSPQIHSTLYGYFQHSFFQHARGGFWRPAVCFNHALVLGRFFAFAAFVAILPLRNVFARQVPGGGFLFLAPLAGLIVSQSWSPMLLFIGLCGSYLVFRHMLVLAYALPIASFIFLAGVFMGVNPLYGAVDVIAQVNPQRAESFRYRLDALDEHRVNILQRPMFGWGGWGNGRIAGRATDSVFLTRALSRGLGGAALLYAYYFCLIYAGVDSARRARGTPIANDVLAVAVLTPFTVALCSVDAGMDGHVIMLSGAMAGLQLTLMNLNAAGARLTPARAAMMQRRSAPARV